MNDLIQMLISREKEDGLRSHLVRGATGTFSLKIAVTCLSFIATLLLTRLLGSKGYGAYAYAMAWVGLLGVPAVLGLDKLLVRTVAAYETQSAWSLLRGLLRWANQAVLLISVGLALAAAVATWAFAPHLDSQALLAFWVGLISLPLFALTNLRQAAMCGLKHVVLGQLPEMLISPIVFILLLGSAYVFLGGDLSAPKAAGMNVAATGVAFSIGVPLLQKSLPQAAKEASPAYQTKVWLSSALPLLFVSGVNVVNDLTDIIMLGAIKGPEAAGIYSVASRGAALITFILQAVNAALAPVIASLYASRDMKRIQVLATRTVRGVLFVCLPVAVGLIVFGYWFLLLFGASFTQGRMALAILSIGQLINAAAGSVALLLMMTDHEKDAATGIGVSAVMNIMLNAILIPRWGLEGAATASATSMTVWNLLLAVLVYRRLGIHSTVLGKISFGSKQHEKT